LDADREAIGFQPDRDLWVDVLHFRACLEECTTHGHPPAEICPTSAALLAEAVTLVQGEFLSGLGLKDSLNFDDWQIIQAETVRQELAGAFERLVRRHSGQREFETALAYARRQLALDPLDESAHRQIMCLDTWSGRRLAALRQFDECVALLRDQLDVPPQEATRQLYADLQSGGVPPLPTTPDLVAELPPFLKGDLAVERPVFARERDLAQMDRYLDGALGGRGQMVFVTGDAGSS
jgi:DNA-binding SARP family transcriptional activator